jgi:hypothetical protein
MPRTRAALPAPLASAARRFERWRAERTTRRIPEELWALAADLGACYGVNRTSRALHVHYDALKKRVQATPPQRAERVAELPTFVEIGSAPPTPQQPGAGRVEFEKASGEKMVVHLGGACHANLTELARVFLGRLR